MARWKGADYGDFDTWRSRSGNDRHSMFADPGFVDPAAQDSRWWPARPRRRRGVGGHVGLDRPRGRTEGPGWIGRHGRLRGRTPASLAHAVDRRRRHLRRRSSVASGPQRVGRSRDRSQQRERAPDDGVPIMIGTRSFEHGIGAHAPSRIVVELDGRCSLFLADVGVDEEVGEAGSVVFEVWAGDERLTTSGRERIPGPRPDGRRRREGVLGDPCRHHRRRRPGQRSRGLGRRPLRLRGLNPARTAVVIANEDVDQTPFATDFDPRALDADGWQRPRSADPVPSLWSCSPPARESG